MIFRMFSPFTLTAALAIFFPSRDAGFDRAHIAVAAMTGAADGADDDVVDD